MRSSTRLRLIALCVNLERLWKDGFDHDHDHVDHVDDHDHVDHDAFDYGHAHAIELSASPVQGSHPYKGFVANTLIHTFQAVSGDIFQGFTRDTVQCVLSDILQSDTFWSAQVSCHYFTKIPLLPAKFHIINLVEIPNLYQLNSVRKYVGEPPLKQCV